MSDNIINGVTAPSVAEAQTEIQTAFAEIVGTTVNIGTIVNIGTVGTAGTLAPLLLAAAANDLAAAGTNIAAQNTVEALFHIILGRDPVGTVTPTALESQELQAITALYLAGTSLSQLQAAFAGGVEVANDLKSFYTQINGGTLNAGVLAFDQQLLSPGNPAEGDAATPTLAQVELAIVGQNRTQAAYNDLFLANGTYTNSLTVNGWLSENGWLSNLGDGTSLEEVTFSNSASILAALAQTTAAANFVSTLNNTGTAATQAQLTVAKTLLAEGASNQDIANSFHLSATAPQVWLAPPNVMLTGGASQYVDGVWQTSSDGAKTMPDLEGLFNIDGTNSPLAGIAPGRSVFEMSEQEAFWFSNSTLSSMFDYLDTNNIALSLQCGMAPKIESPGTVSASMEGYAPLNAIIGPVQRIYDLGGNLAYIAMDEPVAFNYAPGGADYTPATLANLMANNVKDVEAYFPNVQIGDIEPIGGATQLAQIENFASAYASATGQQLAFLRADVNWSDPNWQTDLQQLAAFCRASNIQFQIIYDGGDTIDARYNPVVTSLEWAEATLRAMATAEADPLLRPEAGNIATWGQYPETAMPVNDDASLTYLERQYATISPLYLALANTVGTVTPAAITAPMGVMSATIGQTTAITGVSIALPASITSNPTIQVILTVGDGTLHVGGSAQVSGNGGDGLVLTGTQSQINSALSTLTYTRTEVGADLLQIASVGSDAKGDNPLAQAFVALDTIAATGTSFNGDDNTFIANGATLYQVSGFGDTVTVDSSALAGTSVTGDGNLINCGTGAVFTVTGDDDSIAFGGGDTLTVTGTVEAFTFGGTANTALLTDGSNLLLTINGGGGSATLTSLSDSLSYNNVVTMTGAASVTLNNQAFLTVNAGAGDIVNLGTGDAGWIDINGGGAVVSLASGIALNASGDTLTVAAGVYFGLAGTADTVILGAGDIVNVGAGTIVANGTTTAVTSASDHFTLGSGSYLGLLGGAGFSITGNGGTIATWSNTGFSVGGNDNLIHAADDDALTLVGSGGGLSSGNTVDIGGGATLTATDQTFLIVNATAGDIVNLGAGNAGWIDINGGGAVVSLASSIALNASGDTLTVAAGVDFGLAGTADTVTLGAGDIVNVGAGTIVANGTTTAVTSTSDNFTLGSGNDTVDLASGNNTVDVSAGAVSGDVLTGGSGTNTLVLTTAGTFSLGGVSNFGAIFLGAGNNTVTVTDKTLSGGSVALHDGASGNNSISEAGDTSASTGKTLTYYTGTGTDSLAGGFENDLVYVQAASVSGDTLTGGSGTNTLELTTAGTFRLGGVSKFGAIFLDAGNNTVTVTDKTLSGGSVALHDGASGNNSISEAGDTSASTGKALTYYTGTGTDSLTGGFENDLVYAQAASVGSDTLAGGSGTDTLVLTTAGTFSLGGVSKFGAIFLGAGNNAVTMTDKTLSGGSVALHDGASGNNSISAAGDTSASTGKTLTYYTGTGTDSLAGGFENDLVYAQAASVSGDTLTGGSGTNTLVLTTAGTFSLGGVSKFGAILLGAGNNTVNISAAAVSDDALTGGSGTNTLVLTTAGAANLGGVSKFTTIDLATGNNTVKVADTTLSGGSVAIYDAASGNNSISAAGDTSASKAKALIYYAGTGTDSFTGGFENDTVHVSATAVGGDTLTGGSGTNTLVLTTAGTFSLGGVSNFGAILLGAGNNTVDVSAAAVSDDALTGGSGTNTLVLTTAGAANLGGVSKFATIDLATGNSTVKVADTTLSGGSVAIYDAASGNNSISAAGDTSASKAKALIYYAGTGTDSFTGGFENDTVHVSAMAVGGDTLTGGSGENTLILTTASAVKLGGVSKFSAIDLAAGNSTVTVTNTTLSGGSVTINDGASGNNSISAAGDTSASAGKTFSYFTGTGTDSFTGGFENDTVHVSAASVGGDTLTGGSGTNMLVLTTAGTFSLGGVSNFAAVFLGAGNNTVTVTDKTLSGGSVALHDGASGNNSISDAGDTSASTGKALTYYTGTGTDSLAGGFENDLVYVQAASVGGDTLTGGSGTDTLVLTTAGTFSLGGVSKFGAVFLGAGNNTVTVTDKTLSGGSLALHDGASGNNSISAAGDTSASTGKTLTYYTGTGTDSLAGGFENYLVYVQAASVGGDTLAGGSGTNTLVLTTAGTFSLGGVSNFGAIFLGAGGNTVTVTDKTLSGGSVALHDGASGNNSISAAGDTSASTGKTLTYYTGTGTDSLTGGFENDLVYLQAASVGGDTLTGGSGTNTLVLTTAGIYSLGGVSNFGAIFLGAGNNAVTMTDKTLSGGSVALHDGASGNNSISAAGDTSASTGKALTYYTGTGTDSLAGGFENDFVYLQAASVGGDTLTGGSGTNTLVLTTAGIYSLGGISNFGAIFLGAGNNTVTVTDKTLSGGSVALHDEASGNNSIGAAGDTSASTGKTLTYYTGTGTDSFAGGFENDTIVAANATLNARDAISGGSGANTLILSGGGTFNLAAPTTLTNIQTVDAAEGQAAGGGVPNGAQTVDLRDGLNQTVNVASGTPNPLDPNPETITINGAANNDVINLGTGTDTVVLGSAGETVNGGGGMAVIDSTTAFAGALVNGTAGATTTLTFTNGGTATLNPNDNHLIVDLTAATNLTLSKMSFITAEGSTGADTITAMAQGQTLTGGGGNDTLIGYSGFGDVFSDTSAHLNTTTIQLFGGSDVIDLTDMYSSLIKPLVYNTATETLTVSDGTHTSNIKFVGNYTLSDFQTLGSDGHTGSLIKFD